jgi:hypothetical protein
MFYGFQNNRNLIFRLFRKTDFKYATLSNKISGYQPRQVVEWRKSQRFEDGDGPRNVGFSAIQPLDAAGSPRRFYYT